MTASAFIEGVAGTSLTDDERALMRGRATVGLHTFCAQYSSALTRVRHLVQEFRGAVGRDAPVLIDQEGGRVQRLGPPHWPTYPPGRAYGERYGNEINGQSGEAAVRLGARLIAPDLAELGITVDCVPVADVPIVGADSRSSAIAPTVRPLMRSPSARAAAGAAGLDGGGVLPVIKHIPGHGRAKADSHSALPGRCGRKHPRTPRLRPVPGTPECRWR